MKKGASLIGPFRHPEGSPEPWGYTRNNFGKPRQVTHDPEIVQGALNDLIAEFGPGAGLWAAYAAASAWWRERWGVWGHQECSCVHSEFSDAYRGLTSWLSQQPPERQEEIRREAARVYADWEDAGRPGLIERIESVRTFILTLPNFQKGGAA